MANAQTMLLFCEDTREEIGNKLSLMGLFGPEITIPSEDRSAFRFSVVLLVRSFSPDPISGELAIDLSSIAENKKPPASPTPFPVKLEAPAGHPSEWTAQVVGSFAGMPIHDGLVISARFDGGDLKANGSVTIRIIAPELESTDRE